MILDRLCHKAVPGLDCQWQWVRVERGNAHQSGKSFRIHRTKGNCAHGYNSECYYLGIDVETRSLVEALENGWKGD